ncbi:MAG: Uma2 family endonuclease [Herpetosiphon sp.]|nr:Uma2 family endonuclease [Herpetosiphon sp.]
MTTHAVESWVLPYEQPLDMSYVEFEALNLRHAEWCNGKVTIFMPPSLRHQLISKFLLKLIDDFVEHYHLGIVIPAPFEMAGIERRSYREPDLLFVASENRERLTPQRLIGPADLIIEIISPESAYRDRVEKFDEYEAIGVTEYWIVDPTANQTRVWCYVRDEAGMYQRQSPNAQGQIASQVLRGFWLDPRWLEHDEMPNSSATFRQIIGQ